MNGEIAHRVTTALAMAFALNLADSGPTAAQVVRET